VTFEGYACYNCGELGHLAGNCPAKVDNQSSKTERHMPSDDTIRQRIERFYQPATEAEMTGLVNTWKQHYRPGAEHPMAPRYPPGFLGLLRARARETGGERGDSAGWCTDIREMLRIRAEHSPGVSR
jgi:hypothetical protein